MSLSTRKGTSIGDKIGTTSNGKPLNPNAAEFIPFALRSSTESSNTADILSNQTLGKSVIDRSESLISNISDDEIHQYWRQQLPDDITPDFEIMGQDEHHGISNLTFANLCLQENQDVSRFSNFPKVSLAMNEQVELPLSGTVANNFASKMRYSMPYGEDVSSTNFIHLPNKPWDDSVLKNDQLLTTSNDGSLYNGTSAQGPIANDLAEQSMVETSNVNPFELLAMQFPGFSAESLGDVYFANGCDLNLTIEMLTQLELQVDISFNQNQNSKALSTPNFSGLDFPALPVSDSQNGVGGYFGEDVHQPFSPYKSTSKDNLLSFTTSSTIQPRGAVDFASAVRKMSSRDSNARKYDRNVSPVAATVGSSRSSNLLASSFSNGQTRGIGGDGFHNRTSSRAAPSWLETGEAVGNLYSDMREEARDHARIRNVYFEQARQAYLIGNKALAKELSMKGQVHNMQMKAAHGKAQESIYRQRNPEVGNGRVQERIIDLHGLHVNEAIPVLKRELALLRAAARSEDQRVQVYICVGTGHHTRGSRTPARLPIAVQRYLLEEESLDYSEPQPGLLRVLVR